MLILVQRTRRHRRWAGVALFAALLMTVVYWDRNEVWSEPAQALPPDGPGSYAAFEPASIDAPTVWSTLPFADPSPQGTASDPADAFTTR